MNEPVVETCCALTVKHKRCKNKKEYCSPTGFCVRHNKMRGVVHIKTDIECSICINPAVNPKKLGNCVHSYCTDCINKWLYHHNNCPCCRTQCRDQEITNAVLYGVVNLHIMYIYTYTFNASVLDELDYLLIINHDLEEEYIDTKFLLNKEYSFNEFNKIRNNIRKNGLNFVYKKMRYIVSQYIIDYDKKFSYHNVLFVIK